MKKYAVIVAGGSGSRMGDGTPKQFRNLCGRPVLWWSVKAFHQQNPDTQIIIVIPKDFFNLWDSLIRSLPPEEQFPHTAVSGGNTRSESVENGLASISSDDSLVAVHDGARPLVSKDIIEKGWAAAEKSGAAIPVVPLSDSIREVLPEGNKSVDRTKFMAVQTPQVFKTSLLKMAYKKAAGGSFTDDASVVESTGHPVDLFQGSNKNIKLTYPEDFDIAKVLMDA